MKKIVVVFILGYLRFFAKLQVKKFKPLIIGVGGASGKTSLSNFIQIILNKKYRVRQSRGKNSETGIPLNLLGLEINGYTKTDWLKIIFSAPLKVIFDWKKYDVYVAEMGIDSPKEPKNMSYLLKIITPKIGVLTNISYEHSVYFDPFVQNVEESRRISSILELTAQQEGLLISSLKSGATAVLNIDDRNIKSLEKITKAQVVTVSEKDKKSDFYIENVKNFVDKFLLNFTSNGKKYTLSIDNPLPNHFAYSFVLSIAVAKACGIGVSESIKYLQNDFYLPPGRMSVFKGIKDTVIIDSSYNNATLTPILDLLSFIYDIGKQRRRIGIIGDMRELGTMSKTLHEEVAKKILETLDAVILIGPLSQTYISPVLKKSRFTHYSFSNFTAAKSTILEIIKPKDIILVKGSQNTLFLERAVEMLLENEKDRDKLCRRGEYWERVREKTP